MLFDSESLTDQALYRELLSSYNLLCGKILRYIQAVDKEFETPNFLKELGAGYDATLNHES